MLLLRTHLHNNNPTSFSFVFIKLFRRVKAVSQHDLLAALSEQSKMSPAKWSSDLNGSFHNLTTRLTLDTNIFCSGDCQYLLVKPLQHHSLSSLHKLQNILLYHRWSHFINGIIFWDTLYIYSFVESTIQFCVIATSDQNIVCSPVIIIIGW